MTSYLTWVQRLSIGLLGVVAPSWACAQQPAAPTTPDETQIHGVLNAYFQGWATGDTATLARVLHAGCQLKYLRDGQYAVADKRTYLSWFRPRPAADARTRMLRVQATGYAASAVTEIEHGPNRFTDYLNLLKLNGQWFIVDKVAFRQEKPATPDGLMPTKRGQ